MTGKHSPPRDGIPWIVGFLAMLFIISGVRGAQLTIDPEQPVSVRSRR